MEKCCQVYGCKTIPTRRATGIKKGPLVFCDAHYRANLRRLLVEKQTESLKLLYTVAVELEYVGIE
jgi:hypothetical protein